MAMTKTDWRAERERMRERIAELAEAGKCFHCEDLETGRVFGDQPVLYTDERFKVVLDRFPRMLGHTVVTLRPHRDGLSDLTRDETADLFGLCSRVSDALETALGAERVYLQVMCDGPGNHIHVQLMPRYPSDPMGSGRLVAPRQPITNAEETAAKIRRALTPA